MKRTLRILWFLFSYHYGILLFTIPGLSLLAIGVVPALMGLAPLPWAFAGILLIWPALWSAAVVRQLCANPRFTMVPQFRQCAVGALFLIPLIAAVLRFTYFVVAADTPDWNHAMTEGLGIFVMTGAGLLLIQWLSTFRMGLVFQLLVLFVVWRYLFLDIAPLPMTDFRWPATAATLLGWVWFFLQVRHRQTLAPPTALQRMEHLTGENVSAWRMELFAPWMPGRPSRPESTLLRGAGDSWMQRLGPLLFVVVGLPSLWALWTASMPRSSHPFGEAGSVPMFLISGLFFSSLVPALTMAEWPARLRALWLRSPGDRRTLWRALEREVYRDALLVLCITTGIALVAWRVSNTDAGLLVAYSVGCAVGMVFSAMFVIWWRCLGQTVLTLSFTLPFLWFLTVGLIAALGTTLQTAHIVMMAVFAVAAGICRFTARGRVLKLDWCAVRPARRSGIRRVRA